jgi:acyl dehydratase
MNEVWQKPPISLADYQAMVGREVGISSWHLVDQQRTEPPVHPCRSRRTKAETSFGAAIAHGFLTMSLMSVMSYEVMPVISGTTMSVNYGFDKLRFISPGAVGITGAWAVYAGRREIAQGKGIAIAYQCHRRDRGREKPALVADWIGLIYFD